MSSTTTHGLIRLVRRENEAMDSLLLAFLDALAALGHAGTSEHVREQVFRLGAVTESPGRLPGRKLLRDALVGLVNWPERIDSRLGEPRRELERVRELEHALLASEVLGGVATDAFVLKGRLFAALQAARNAYVEQQLLALALQHFTLDDWGCLDARAAALAAEACQDALERRAAGVGGTRLRVRAVERLGSATGASDDLATGSATVA